MLALFLMVSGAHAAAVTGTMTFADLDGQGNNSQLPSPSYSVGLPDGVTASWSGWLVHTKNPGDTPMSVFPAYNTGGLDGEIQFSQPVRISSVRLHDSDEDSNTCYVAGYRAGAEVWRFLSTAEGIWHVVTTGSGIEIDMLAVEGKWNHLDDIVVTLEPPDPVGIVTFEDQVGQPNNSSMPGDEYNSGLPAGVAARWTGWLLHTDSGDTPMCAFPQSAVSGFDGEIEFTRPVYVSSLNVWDSDEDSSPFSVMGYRLGEEVWRYDSSSEGSWETVTAGDGIVIDTLAVEGKWNRLDDITVVIPEEAAVDPPRMNISRPNQSGMAPIQWFEKVGQKYQLQSTTSLVSGSWKDIGSLVIGQDAVNSITVDTDAQDSMFYRMGVETIPSDEIRAETEIAANGLPTPPAGQQWVPLPAYTDEFNGTELDTSKWQYGHPYWSGRDPSVFLDENISVANGKLRIRNTVWKDPATVTDPTSDVWVGAGCVTSINNTAHYGYYEAKIKGSALCMTSAFWFQNTYSEIDVVEQLGWSYNNPWKRYKMQINSHYYPTGWPNDIATPTNANMPSAVAEEYHVYGVWWKNANTLWIYHNREKVAEVTTGGPFNNPMYMFLDTEVFTWEGLPTTESLQDPYRNTMYVDWVRGWELVPE